jgi:uncharacterized repeat protein (TIGR01451 family)
MTSAKRFLGGLLMVGLLFGASCDFATDVELLEVRGTGVLLGQTFLDLNGNGVADAGDQPLRNAGVVLTTASGDVVLQATTDTLGIFVLLSVPVGTYDLDLDSAAVLADSLNTLTTAGTVTVELGDTTFFSIGATYPTLTLEEVRTAAPGRRVFTTGVALNPRLSSTDGTVHLLDTALVAYLRTTNMSLPVGSVLTGDSLRVLGRTAVDNGQPTLNNVTPIVLLRGLFVPPPEETTTADAATADAGALDAALARIRRAEISDTSTAPNSDFHFWVDDGTDSLEIVFKAFRGIDPASVGIRPDTIVRVNQMSGLLTPFDDGTGSVRWRLLPRAASEVLLETKRADIAVATSFTPTTAPTGDTVDIRVIVTNALPAAPAHVTATGVSVTDTIPTGLTFVSATATRGSYSETTFVWDVGDLTPAAADTLTIRAEVTAGPSPPPVTNTARSNGLVLEEDPNPGNNQQSANLTVS